MSFGANGMTWVLRNIQIQLFSYQKWLERSSRTVFAQFVVLKPTLKERARYALNMSFGANEMTWVLRKIQIQLFSYQRWLEFMNNFRTLCHMRTKTPRTRGMTWVLRKIQIHLFSYQKWLERSSRTVFAQFVVPEPKLQERTRNELNMIFGANGMTWMLRKI